MIGDLFDSPWKVLILAVVILVLFGSRKLPDAARSLGRSMRILKAEIHDMHDGDEHPADTAQPTAVSASPAATAAVGSAPAGPAAAAPVVADPAPVMQQQKVEQLQRQIDELRSQAADTQQTQAR